LTGSLFVIFFYGLINAEISKRRGEIDPMRKLILDNEKENERIQKKILQMKLDDENSKLDKNSVLKNNIKNILNK
jgi:hypothetical protein